MKPSRCPPLLLSLALAASGVAQCHDLDGVTAVADDLLAQAPLAGNSCVRVDQFGSPVYERAFGSFTLAEVVPIASATKTLSAAVLLSLVDDGVLQLDDRVGQYLPEWNLGLRANITLRMCFAHTSGMQKTSSILADDTITLRQAALQLAALPLEYVPGSTFAYGGISMHVAGAVCEVATGQSWDALFAQRIAAPLGMTATDFAGFGVTSNPRIAGGAQSSLRDYARFVDMLRAGGTWNGAQVLSQASVDEMLTDQTAGTALGETPHPDQAPYGLGIWLERRDGNGDTTLAAAAGAFGFIGWVDRAHDASGVFLTRYLNQVTYPFVRRIWDELDAALLPPGVQCVGIGSPQCAAGAWLNALSQPRSGNGDWALRAARAPANGLGVVLLGDVAPSGVPFVDLLAFVDPLDVATTIVADGDGVADLPVPLPGGLSGLTFGLQALWLFDDPCPQLDLQASHGLRVDVP